MKRVPLLMCVLLMLMQCTKENAPAEKPSDSEPERSTPDRYVEVNRTAVTAVDYLRMRAEPTIESRILGRLLKDTEVLLLRRTPYMDTVSSNQDYWYELTTIEGIRAWCFGQFLRLTENEKEETDFVGEYDRSVEIPDQNVDLSIVNELERANKHSEADLLYRKLPDLPMVGYITNERRLLRRSSFVWLRDTPEDIYRGIEEQLSGKMSVLPYIPPSIDFGTYAGEFWGIFSNSELNEFLLNNLEDRYSISELIVLSADRAVFYIDQAAWGSQYNRLLLCISKISGAVFEKLNNKYELTTVMFTFQMPYADPTGEEFIITYPYYKRWVYGMESSL
jgi:hypothetical protein